MPRRRLYSNPLPLVQTYASGSRLRFQVRNVIVLPTMSRRNLNLRAFPDKRLSRSMLRLRHGHPRNLVLRLRRRHLVIMRMARLRDRRALGRRVCGAVLHDRRCAGLGHGRLRGEQWALVARDERHGGAVADDGRICDQNNLRNAGRGQHGRRCGSGRAGAYTTSTSMARTALFFAHVVRRPAS